MGLFAIFFIPHVLPSFRRYDVAAAGLPRVARPLSCHRASGELIWHMVKKTVGRLRAAHAQAPPKAKEIKRRGATLLMAENTEQKAFSCQTTVASSPCPPRVRRNVFVGAFFSSAERNDAIAFGCRFDSGIRVSRTLPVHTDSGFIQRHGVAREVQACEKHT